ncbi:DUF1553 domain-containing protein [Planctomycetaceae bacterium SH139]
MSTLRSHGIVLLFAIFGAFWFTDRVATAADEASPDQAGLEFFESKIRPILVQECYSCHAADAKQIFGGLILDHRDGLLAGGDSGPAVVPGDVAASLLIDALRHDSFEMPPRGKLDQTIIDDFVRWVEIGAPDPRTETTPPAAAKSIAMSLADAKEFWSFQPPVMPPLPAVSTPHWTLNGIDYFVQAKLESAGLRPVDPASKRVWIRRATFDLIGLPPKPEEIEDFLADESPAAYEVVIDRLLASPHYGQRWGRHWLDVARYAEDQAHTFAVKPSASGYRYRDWVIDAFNSDLSYKKFVQYQIAADLMEMGEEERFRHLPALGFFGLGAQYYKNTDAAKARADELDDRVDTLTRAFLGLTVSCARCHDHKYDPIPTQDYYSLAGVFQSCRLADQPLVPAEEVAAFTQAEQRLKQAEEAVKNFIASEKRGASEALATDFAAYLLVAWQIQQAALSDNSAADIASTDNSTAVSAVNALATQRGLSELVLQRFVDMLGGDRKATEPVLKDWFAHTQALVANSADTQRQPLPPDSLTELAQAYQAELILALDIRAGRKPASSVTGDAVASDASSDQQAAAAEPSRAAGTPRYSSPLVTRNNPIVDLNVDLRGGSELYLVITDAGNGKSCDHADWLEPRFVTASGEIKLTDLKWKAVDNGFGQVNINRNVSGQPLRAGGVSFENGLGTHAPCVLVYDIPPGATHFKARAGLDNGGSDQGGCGQQASIQFRVYTERPNDYALIMKGEVQPDQGVLDKVQAALLEVAFSDKGLFAVADEQLEEILTPDKRERLAELRAEFSQAKADQRSPYPVAHVIDEAKPTDLNVYIRGNPARQGELAPRRFLQVLSEGEPAPFTQGSGRLELAEAIANDQNPLTARVMVNRIWQHHFGRGLVRTASNFGVLGERPTHPQLLDYLTRRFIEADWSIKALHREIMLSATYRLSSQNDASNSEIDADNSLLWRMNRRRLDVEAWRDSLLAVSGQLDVSLGGPSTNLDAVDNLRRTVYGKISRHDLNPLLRLFDFPDANITSASRSQTIVPQQQLFVLNSPFMIQQARVLADKLFAGPQEAWADSIRHAFELLYGRPATDREVSLGLGFLQADDSDAHPDMPRTVQYAQVLLAANEFTFID